MDGVGILRCYEFVCSEWVHRSAEVAKSVQDAIFDGRIWADRPRKRAVLDLAAAFGTHTITIEFIPQL